MRQIMLRPMTTLQSDHPNFTGSNPQLHRHLGRHPINGPWDVDNDGDGVPDSVWVDLGIPVRATADGRLYKPLFAILCVDLDGRLNLNAHGMLAQADRQPITPDVGHDRRRLCGRQTEHGVHPAGGAGVQLASTSSSLDRVAARARATARRKSTCCRYSPIQRGTPQYAPL